MKLVSLNAWHGEQSTVLKDYLAGLIGETDIFCFQESSGAPMEAILDELFDNSRFMVQCARKYFDDNRNYSLKTIIKNPIELLNSHTILDESDADTGQAIATTLRYGDVGLTVVNTHGIAFPGSKLDNEGRLRQSAGIIKWLKENTTDPAVICGDFNLLIETESVRMFEKAGFRNLIRECSIPTTRNRFAWERWPGMKQLYADYAFASPELDIAGFEVPSVEVSDHLPMILDLNLNRSLIK